MSKQSVLFIVNPVSGYSNKEDIHELIDLHLDKGKFDYKYIETQHKGHGFDIAQDAVKDTDIIVACGGDGTVNEIASAVVNTNKTLGILPNGSGNGFAMHIGMGRNTVKAIKKFNKATSRKIDSCSVNGHFFLNIAGVGFDALIAYKADSGTKRGIQMYLQMVSKEMMRFKAEYFKVEIDGQLIEGPFTTIAVANSAMYGYNFTIAPLANLTDGLFDFVFIKEATLARTIGSSWRMLNNSIDKSSLVKIIKGKEATITTQSPYYYHIDGESMTFEKELNFKMNPLSLNVLIPENSKAF